MYPTKVIITKQERRTTEYFLENEVGLSTYDLALISIDKIFKKSTSSIDDKLKTTFLI